MEPVNLVLTYCNNSARARVPRNSSDGGENGCVRNVYNSICHFPKRIFNFVATATRNILKFFFVIILAYLVLGIMLFIHEFYPTSYSLPAEPSGIIYLEDVDRNSEYSLGVYPHVINVPSRLNIDSKGHESPTHRFFHKLLPKSSSSKDITDVE